jgi:hypothetical protein
MKSLHLAFVLAILCSISKAQVSISVQLPPSGLIDKQQLWNMVLINSGRESLETFIRISLQEVSTGQVLMTAQTNPFICAYGTKVITERDLQPIQFNFNHPDFSKRYLPLGQYVICYRVFNNGLKGEEPLTDECITINIEPLSPVMLNYPLDQSSIQSYNPQFSWTPPAPFDMFTNLSYILSVCEVKDGQKPIEAMLQNVPVYSRGDLSQPFELLQTAAYKLLAGKTYAWQVTAINQSKFVSKSDVWSFKVEKDSIAAIVSAAPYVKLSKEISEASIVHQGHLKISYRNQLSDSTGYFTVREVTGQGSKEKQSSYSFKLPIQRGENFLEYDLNKYGKLKKSVYEVVFTNTAGEIWYMRFIPVYY